MLKRNLRVLVCGPSNVSVDNIVERLAPHKLPIVRIGHPARLLPSVLNHSLDVLTQTSDAASIVQDVRKEMDAKQASIKKTRNGRERKVIYGYIKELRKEYRERENKCVSTLLAASKVVLATLHGAGGFQLRNEKFDVVIIDEASQALEAQCWVPLLSAQKVVLAGDHLQLPPTIKSASDKKSITKRPKENTKEDNEDPTKVSQPSRPTSTVSLETTLFDRLLSLYGPRIKRMLTVQYRMHQTIMSFPSKELYENKLTAHSSVAKRTLPGLPYKVSDTDDTREPLIFFDTQGGNFPESSSADALSGSNNDESPKKTSSIMLADSKANPMEAALAAHHVASLIEAGVHEGDVAVITPYNAQLSLLSSLLRTRYPGIELGTVDGFQGREKEAVILTLVRSNADGVPAAAEAKQSRGGSGAPSGNGVEVGFLGEKRRLNVGMTRPRRQLCVIGDGETVGRGSGFLHRWIDYLEENAEVRYPDVSELQQQQ